VLSKEVAVTINVALVFSGVLGDLLVSVIERDPEFHLTARGEDSISVIRLCESVELHAIVLCAPTGSIPLATQRLMERGACRAMIAITPDGKHGWLHVPHREPCSLPGLSPARLLTAIRDVVASDGKAPDA
jgi:hypothetical protein